MAHQLWRVIIYVSIFFYPLELYLRPFRNYCGEGKAFGKGKRANAAALACAFQMQMRPSHTLRQHVSPISITAPSVCL